MFDTIIVGLLAVGLLALCYFDINSTKDVLKKGTGYEANPVMAWLQKKLPTGWPYVKSVLALLVAFAAVHLPRPFDIMVLAVLDAMYYVIVNENYSIAKGN